MDKKLIIKIFKKRAKSKDLKSRVIVVTHNTCSVHGGYRYDRIGYLRYKQDMYFCYINLYKLGYWLNKGVSLKTKVSWLAGLLGYVDNLNIDKKYENKLK